METLTTHFRLWAASLLMLGFSAATLPAATIVWTNTAGGSFGNAANWSPNAAPGSGDLVVITNTGTYTVTLDAGRTIAGLQLGANSGGTQTFSMNGNALTLSGSTIINTNGILIISANVSFYTRTVTNNGTVAWTAGSITDGGAAGKIYNNGLWDVQGNNSFVWQNDGLDTPAVFNNAGIFRKSGGSATTTVPGAFNFNNTGTLDVQSGTVSVVGNGANTAPGVFNTTNGATLSFNNNYTFNTGSQFTGNGTSLLSAGIATLNGNIIFTKLTLAGATVAGTHVLNGNFIITGGGLTTSGSTTIASNSTMSVAATVSFYTRTVTNNGTVAWATGSIIEGGAAGVIYNNGLWDVQGDNSFVWQNDGLDTPAVFNNAGSFRKSGGSATTTMPGAFNFNNTGTLDVQSGTVSVVGNGANTAPGVFNTTNGATLSFNNNYTFNTGSQFTGNGTSLLSAGIATLNGNIIFTKLTLAGATVAGTHVLNGNFIITGGGLTTSGSTTIASNSTMSVAATVSFYTRTVTNNGTVAWATGSIIEGGAAGVIYNNGLWDVQGDNSFVWQNDGLDTPAVFNNAGSFRKSGGSATTTVPGAFNFNNTGTNDVQSGTVSLAGGGGNSSPGVFNATNGATLSFNNNYTFNTGSQFKGNGTILLAAGTAALNGNIIFTKLTLAGATLAGTHVLNGNFIITGGSLATSGSSTIASGSTLNVAATVSFYTRTVTNNGTVAWATGSIIEGGAAGVIYNNGLWDVQGDNSFVWQNDGLDTPAVFNNAGIFRKSGGSATTTVPGAFNFNNTGTNDVQSGTVSLSGPHNLAGGTINIGISSLSSFGKVILSGASGFTGNFSANLNGGYIPITNNTFAVITYGSLSGTFGNYNLPFADAWTNIYSPTTFSLYVRNARPIPPAPTNQIVNELVQLTVTNTAIDLDIPTNTLIYTLLAPPAGASINSSGIITWTPDETQGPGTNLITTIVTDNGTPSLSATNSFSVVVNEINVPPVLSPLANTNLDELTTLRLTNSATDSDIPVNSLTYVLTAAPVGAAIDTNGVITWTPTEAQGPSTNTFTTVVTDTNIWAVNTQSFTFTNTFTVVVKESNSAPVLFLPISTNIDELAAYTAQATALDTDIPINAETFALVSGPPGLTVSPSGAINWTPDESQGSTTNIVIIVVTDFNPWAINPQHLSATNSYQLVVNEINVAPVLPVISNTSVNEMVTLTVTNTATDSDLPPNPLTYTLQAAPMGAAIDTNGVITWTPTEAQGPSTNTFTTVVTDTNSQAVNAKSLSWTNTFSVVVNEVNVAPVLNLPADTNINEQVAYTAFAAATDADLPTNKLTFGLVSGPAGLTVSTNGTIRWTPTEAQGPSTNTVLISVTDTNPIAVNGTSLSVTNSYQIVVHEVNTAPFIDVFDPHKVPQNPTINELQPYTFTIIGDDSDVPTNQLTYELVSGPAGLTISTNGVLNWTPTEAQGVGLGTNYNVQVRVIDYSPLAVNATSLSNQIVFGLIVREVNSAPVLNAISDQSVTPGQTVSFTATATDTDVPTNTLSFTLISPPAGATINSSSGVFSWRPSAALANTTNLFQVQVTDNGAPALSDLKSFHVMVNSLAPVVLTPNAFANDHFLFSVSGSTGPDYIIMASTNLTTWSDVFTNLSPTTPFQFDDTDTVSILRRYYRARLSP